MSWRETLHWSSDIKQGLRDGSWLQSASSGAKPPPGNPAVLAALVKFLRSQVDPLYEAKVLLYISTVVGISLAVFAGYSPSLPPPRSINKRSVVILLLDVRSISSRDAS